jgi:hypothetical protein
MNYNLILDSQLVFHFHLFVLSIRKKQTKYELIIKIKEDMS